MRFSKEIHLANVGELYEICQGSHLTQENSKLPSPACIESSFLEKSRALYHLYRERNMT